MNAVVRHVKINVIYITVMTKGDKAVQNPFRGKLHTLAFQLTSLGWRVMEKRLLAK